MTPRPQLFREPGADGDPPSPTRVNSRSAQARRLVVRATDGYVRRYAEDRAMFTGQAADGVGHWAMRSVLRLLGADE